MVYIDEAHASDRWPLGSHVDLPHHQTIEDRQKGAQLLMEKFNFQLPILLDTMDNQFDSKYAVWPERYYFIKEGKMEIIGEPTTEFGYDRNSLLYSILRCVKQNEC